MAVLTATACTRQAQVKHHPLVGSLGLQELNHLAPLEEEGERTP